MTAAPGGLPGAGDVSRETLDRLEVFAGLVRKWSPRINLVSPGALPDLWARHIVDSAQLASLAPLAAHTWLDLGSGAGFPGVVVAILRPDLQVSLVESDQRKASFLRTALRETGTDATVHALRVEALQPQNADVVSARALAPLDRLLSLAAPHLSDTGTAIFPKGARAREEIENALESWRFRCEEIPSATDRDGAILRLSEITRA